MSTAPAIRCLIPRDGVIPALSSNGNKIAQQAAKTLQGKKPEKQWRRWAEHLANRQKPKSLLELIDGKTPPLLWSAHDPGALDEASWELITRLSHFGRPDQTEPNSRTVERLTQWLSEAEIRKPDRSYALESLAWCHALPWLASLLDADLWWRLVDHLAAVADDANHVDASDRPLTAQLLGGELPLALGYLFPEAEPSSQLMDLGVKVLSESIVDMLDGDGMPHASFLPWVRGLLASWTRSNLIASQRKETRLKRTARDQFEWFVQQVLRLTRPDGSQVFSPARGKAGKLSWSMLSTAITIVEDPECVSLAEHTLLSAKRKRDGTPWESGLPEEVSSYSAWAELGVLRPNWSDTCPWLVVSFSGRTLRSELIADKQLVWSGDCQPLVEIDGTEMNSGSSWEEACWFSDFDVDYLELELDLGRGWCVQRQIMLAREDYFLYLADAIIGPRKTAIRYTLDLPLDASVDMELAEETREAYLSSRKRLGTVLPLALPEWRSDPRFGQLASTSSGLRLTQSADATCLYAPLWVDLHPSRRRKKLTWRQLTVAEERTIVSRDTAVGYRIQFGNEQWLIYRSLGPKVSRTVLGQHLSTECLIARFNDDGQEETLVEIE